MERNLLCPNCRRETPHTQMRGDVPIGNGMAKVVMNCKVCHNHEEVVQMTKEEYFGLPTPTATYFHCGHCCQDKNHEVTHVLRGTNHATAVLHCNDCNTEARRYFKLEEIPKVILEAEEALRQSKRASAP